jgi:hypothetical protein
MMIMMKCIWMYLKGTIGKLVPFYHLIRFSKRIVTWYLKINQNILLHTFHFIILDDNTNLIDIIT